VDADGGQTHDVARETSFDPAIRRAAGVFVFAIPLALVGGAIGGATGTALYVLAALVILVGAVVMFIGLRQRR
jgi:hypothetical protein